MLDKCDPPSPNQAEVARHAFKYSAYRLFTPLSPPPMKLKLYQNVPFVALFFKTFDKWACSLI